MNYRVLCKVLGWLVLLVAAAMLACEIYAVVAERGHDDETHEWALLKAFAIAAGLGVILLGYGWRAGNNVLRKEGMAIVGLGWIVAAIVGAIPYALCTPALNPAAAFFESASGFTTTGSSVIADLDQYPRSILLWRATTQWLGGMGILVLFVALLSTLGVGSKSLFRNESSAQIGYGFHSRIRETATRLWQIYAGLTVICVAGLMVLGMSFYDALLHGFAAISTGGFSPRNASAAFYGSVAIEAWLSIFMFLGGVSFVLMAWLLRRRFERLRMDEEFKGYAMIIFATTAVIALDLVVRREEGWGQALRESSFQVISVMTTTGFVSADYDAWPTLSKAILVMLMFIGGCSGSTSGGMKVSRVIIFMKTTKQHLINSFRPAQVVPLRLNGQVLSESLVASAVFFLALTFFIVGTSTLVITVIEPN
ncbi:MAG: potassium transporter TrkG, partial [Chthoniobacterales bacterium]